MDLSNASKLKKHWDLRTEHITQPQEKVRSLFWNDLWFWSCQKLFIALNLGNMEVFVCWNLYSSSLMNWSCKGHIISPNSRNTGGFVFPHAAEHFVKERSKSAEIDLKRPISTFRCRLFLPLKGGNFADTDVCRGLTLLNINWMVNFLGWARDIILGYIHPPFIPVHVVICQNSAPNVVKLELTLGFLKLQVSYHFLASWLQ